LPSAVTLRGISKAYGARVAVSDVSLDVAAAEFLAILGPSGSGKTTIIRIIGGFETPDAGSVLIAGEDVTDVPPERRNVNTVFQSYALFPHLTVIDNVAYGPRMRGVPRKERYARAGELLALVHLTDVAQRRPHELSGGMQQRVALARALANRPAVLLLDEPIGALDRKLRDEMQREFRRVRSELATTFIYVTHDQDEAFGMADRLVVMRQGHFEQVGAPAEIYDRPANAWVALFVGGTNTIRARITRRGELTALSSDGAVIEASYLAEGLADGDPVLVAVRPEATVFERRCPGAAMGSANRLPAALVDSVAIGPSIRLRALTERGIAFESIAPRVAEGVAAPALAPGDPIFITFPTSSVRAYRDEDIA
jgi:ABC-type Fe3+/spermidine/putrescine transport system ATPase subunit